MEKTATLNLRVDPKVKKQAEEVLRQLGIPMSVAINMYLNQISLTGGIPFAVTLSRAPEEVNADHMTRDALNRKLETGYADMLADRTEDAAEAFRSFRKRHES